MRIEKINDAKLAKILEERGVVYKEIGEINKQIVKLDEDRKKLGYKMDRLKEKTVPFMEKYEKTFDLGEFEVITSIGIVDGVPEARIDDLIEEYKQSIRDKRNAK